uniref:Uncharacterized protein n=1 Tax=Brassica oleracea var. oleracea TaxID=109376 RepID=A0A0D3AR38_BRAOL
MSSVGGNARGVSGSDDGFAPYLVPRDALNAKETCPDVPQALILLINRKWLMKRRRHLRIQRWTRRSYLATGPPPSGMESDEGTALRYWKRFAKLVDSLKTTQFGGISVSSKDFVDIAERTKANFNQDMGLFTYLYGRINVIVTG